jgi:large subunit ribosomal protein L30
VSASAKKRLRVVQTRSVIGQAHPMRLTIKGLGLKGPGSSAVVDNTPSFRGAIKKVLHLVTVEEVDAKS